MRRNIDKVPKRFRKDEARVKKESVHFDDRVQSELKPNPSGSDFHKLFSSFFGKRLASSFPYLSVTALNYDPNVYQAMLVVTVMLYGMQKNKKDADIYLRFLKSDTMEALKDNTFHREHENNARKNAFDFLKKHKQ